MVERGRSVRELLEWTRARLNTAGIREYRLEAELLLQHVDGNHAPVVVALVAPAVAPIDLDPPRFLELADGLAHGALRSPRVPGELPDAWKATVASLAHVARKH